MANSSFEINGSIIASSGSFIVGSGSAGSPSFEFSGDTDTGMFSPAANTIALATSGVERLRVDSVGNVGIGTATPSGQLDVIGSGIFSSGLFVGSTPVSISGHSHTSSDITNFNSSVSGLINGIYAPLNSPALIGVPTVPTASSGTNTTQIASTAFVRTEISNLVNSAPSTLDTLKELATALGDDPNFATTITNNIAGKANLSGATFTGSISGPSGDFTSLNVSGNLVVSSTGDINTLKINKFYHNNLGVSAGISDNDLLITITDPIGSPTTQVIQGGVLRSSLLNQPAVLRFRQGTETERLLITPASGEPIWTTDSQKLYIGDGTTVGGDFIGPSLYNRGSGIQSIVSLNTGCAANGNYSVVNGGINNFSIGTNSVVGGGSDNTSSGSSNTISGGSFNNSSSSFSTVGGGYGNISSATNSTVSGGSTNTSSGNNSVVGGGTNNTSSGISSTISGGQANLARSSRSFVSGSNNVASSTVRRANNITSSTNTITVFSATAADFDNTTANALQIRYFYNNAWNLSRRTVSSAVQSGNNVTLTLTSNVGSAGQTWSEVSVVNTSETETMVGGTVNGVNNICSNNHSTVGGGLANTSSGSYSTVSGGNTNASSGSYSTVGGGLANTSSGSSSTVGGGRTNTSSGSSSMVGGGQGNTSSGSYSAVCGGNNNASGGSYSTVGGGYSNTSSGSYSTVSGGRTNISSGGRSTVGGGYSNTSSGSYSIIPGGTSAKTTRHGELSHSAGAFDSIGDAQHTILVARGQTTDATPNQVLLLDNSSARLTLPASTAWTFSIKLSAYNNTDNESGWWIIRGGIRRNHNNATTLVGSLITESGFESSLNAASVSVVADDTNEALEIRVTGISDKIIRWVAVVDISQVSFGTP